MKNLFIIVFAIIPFGLLGQFPDVNEHYVLNPFLINPAYAGGKGTINLATSFQRQWAGIKGTPETLTLAADAPLLKEKLGLGLIIVHDRLGVTNETQFITNYAYRIDLGEGLLAFGLGAGITTSQTAWSKLIVLDEEEDKYLTDSRIFVLPDFSFGMYYSYRDFFAGFSIPRLVNYEFEKGKRAYSLKNDLYGFNYTFTTGYTFELVENLKIMPGTLLSYYPDKIFLYDINLYTCFFNRFWTGISYRSDRSLNGLFQFNVNDMLVLAYSYGFDIGKLSSYSSGNHGFMLRFIMGGKYDVASPLGF